MEFYGYRPPVKPIDFKFNHYLATFIIQNQDYLKYLYHNYSETPLNKWFYVYKPHYVIIKPNEKGVMCLYNVDMYGRVTPCGTFRHEYEKWLSEQSSLTNPS